MVSLIQNVAVLLSTNKLTGSCPWAPSRSSLAFLSPANRRTLHDSAACTMWGLHMGLPLCPELYNLGAVSIQPGFWLAGGAYASTPYHGMACPDRSHGPGVCHQAICQGTLPRPRLAATSLRRLDVDCALQEQA